jgi:UDP-glucose 4-epimerase
MRVVVVGATGNIGTSLVAALGADGAVDTVLGVARRRPAWTAPKTEWAAADVATDELAGLFAGAAAVVHLAWLFQPTHRPETTWRVNVEGSIRVFDAVARAGVPALVYSSSVGAYSPGPKDRLVDESWPTNGWPGAAYTREKAYVERVLDVLERDQPGLRVVRLRPGFVFKREAAAEQRRLFAGPLLPGRLVRPGLVPVVPDLPGLRFQALHSADVAEAFRLAVLREDARGAFNVAADPVVDPALLGELLSARPVRLPLPVVRTLVATGWHLHLVPAAPGLFDAVLRLPLMDLTRAHERLGWSATYSSADALREFLAGLREPAGLPTPPLDPHAGGPLRSREFGTGIGQRP